MNKIHAKFERLPKWMFANRYSKQVLTLIANLYNIIITYLEKLIQYDTTIKTNINNTTSYIK